VRQRLKTPLTPISGDLIAGSKEIPLALDKLPTLNEWKQLAQKKGITAYHAQKNFKRLEQGQTLTEKINYPVKSWVFGEDLAMVFLGGEVVIDYSQAIKNQFGKKLWVTSYSNDVPCYIPSERVLTEGGYEGKTRWSGMTCLVLLLPG